MSAAESGASRVARNRRRRAAVLLAVHALMGLHALHWWASGASLAPLELSESLQTAHTGVITAGALLFGAAVLATLRYGRFFCGWGCHFLAVQDLAAAGLAWAGWTASGPRLRALGAVPAVLVGYLYAWPVLERAARGEPAPALHVAGPDAAWASFWTDDLWRSMPGVGLAGLTFAVGGVALVAALGPRAFCATVCPYGVVFGAAERFAPRRIVLTGACSGCARCSAVCLSGIDVLAELRAGGAVRDPACMRDLDCVAVCPTGAIDLDAAPLRPWPPRPAAPRAPWVEEGVAAALVLAGFLALRGLFGVVPIFLALSTAVLVAALAVAGLRRARAWARAPRWSAGGALRAVAAGALAGALILVGGIRWYEAASERAELAARAGEPEAAAQAIAALTQARALSPWCPPRWHARLASLHLAQGELRSAERELEALVAADPADEAARRVLLRVRAARGGGATP